MAMETIFLNNVSTSGGWYDNDKWYNSNGGVADANTCGFASAANIIQWWQNAQPSISTSTPNGQSEGNVYATDVYKKMLDTWGNTAGDPSIIWGWWLTNIWGSYPFASDKFNQAPADKTAGYWSHYDFGQDQFGNTSLAQISTQTPNPSPDTVSNVFYNNLNGNIGLNIKIIDTFMPSGSHAITVWGADFQDKNAIAIYITDSDDGDRFSGDKDLRRISLEKGDYKGNEVFYLGEEYDLGYNGGIANPDWHTTWYIQNIYSFDPSGTYWNIPEPGTAALVFAGLWPLVFGRRRPAVRMDDSGPGQGSK